MPEITSAIPDAPPNPRQLRLRRIGLRVLEGPDKGQTAEFDHDVVRIGTQEGNHFRLTDATVSRRHAEIARTPDGLVLRDLGSKNGTLLDRTRIKAVFLGEERTFLVGQTEMQFTLRDEVVPIVPVAETQFENIVGQSVRMRETFAILDRVAKTELTVMITGETGTGKELVSRAIHQRSARRGGPFVVFDCGAVARSLLESELFGHEKGAFTGAVASRAGVFEQAHGGTIFLDELGELPLELQPALLRVLEQREVRRVGDRRVRAVDVRVLAATNRVLESLVKEQRFREDLYYRLAVVEVHLAPLRERIEDLPMLVDHILRQAPFEHSVKGVTPDVMRLFESYHWPGNVRELKNTLLRAIPFCEGDLVDLHALPDALRSEGVAPPPPGDETPENGSSTHLRLPTADVSLKEARDQLMEAFERKYLEDLLERTQGNLTRAAHMAGVDRKTIARLVKRHGIGG